MPAAAKLSAMVVDDQSTMRELVRTGLQQLGFSDIATFASAAEAIEALRAKPANLVISDVNMPGMDGLEFLRGVRANPALKSTAFIVLTGRADKELVTRAVQLGANNYLVKPFTIASLKQKIEQVLGPLS